MDFKIAKMNENHLIKISENINEFDEFWNVKILKDEFNNVNSEYIVAIYDENKKEDVTIVGFAGLWFNIDEAHIMNIAVKKQFRRNHIGSELLNNLIDIAKSKHKYSVTLEVREDNLCAIKLYEKFGFSNVGRRKRYYNNLVDAIIMTKKF